MIAPTYLADPRDAATLLGVLADRGGRVAVEHVAWGLGWSLDRVEHALVAAQAALAGTGLVARLMPEGELWLGSDECCRDRTAVGRTTRRARQTYTADEIRLRVAVAGLDDIPHPRSLHDFDDEERQLIARMGQEG